MEPLPPSITPPALPAPHHRTAFWTMLAIFILLGLYAVVLAIHFGAIWIGSGLGLGVVLISCVAFLNHRHNHDHFWLLAGATVITLLLSILWTVELLNY